MEVGAQVGQGGRPAAEFLGDGTGLQAAQPHPAFRGGGAEGLHQIDERAAVPEVRAPGGNLDPGEHQLPVTLTGKAFRFTDRVRQRQGTDGPAGVGDDAVGAEIDAAILHLEHGPGPSLQSTGAQALIGPPAQGVVHPDQRLCQPRPGQVLQRVQKGHALAGAHDQVHLQRADGLRRGLSVAAAHRHHRAGRALAGLADGLAGFLIAHRRNGAGVDDIGVGLPREGDQRVAPALQFGLQRLGLVLVDLAAQGIDSNSHVFSSPPGPGLWKSQIFAFPAAFPL